MSSFEELLVRYGTARVKDFTEGTRATEIAVDEAKRVVIAAVPDLNTKQSYISEIEDKKQHIGELDSRIELQIQRIAALERELNIAQGVRELMQKTGEVIAQNADRAEAEVDRLNGRIARQSETISSLEAQLADKKGDIPVETHILVMKLLTERMMELEAEVSAQNATFGALQEVDRKILKDYKEDAYNEGFVAGRFAHNGTQTGRWTSDKPPMDDLDKHTGVGPSARPEDVAEGLWD